MSGWCPSSSVCGMAVVCAAAVLPSAVVRLVPYSSHCSAGEYCCHVVHCFLPGVWCVDGWCVSVLFVWWGLLCVLPPLVVDGGWGRRGWWGGIADGGWHGEGRAVVSLTLPVLCAVSPFRLLSGPVEWRGWCVVCCPLVSCYPHPLYSVPCLRVRSGTLHCPVPLLHCILSCCAARFLFMLSCCCGVCGERGVVCVVCVVCVVLL